MKFAEISKNKWTFGEYTIDRYNPQGTFGFRFRAKHLDAVLGSRESRQEAEMLCREHLRQATTTAFKNAWTKSNGVWVEGKR